MATILIVDDSDTHRAEIRAVLEKEPLFDSIREASNGYDGLKMLLAESVDLVLCDLELPGLDGQKLLRAKASSPGGVNTPFIFLTAETDLDRTARLLDGGAWDAIAKPFHPADLVARLKLHLKVKRLQDELISKNEALQRMSSLDALTGLRTRRYGFDVLKVEFLRAKRYGTPFSLVMADLDHFKQLNDSYGHPGGDAVLRGVSSLLLEAMRRTDVAARYGGEELMVLLPHSNLDGAIAMSERWRARIEQSVFEMPDGRSAKVTVSIGAAAFDSAFESVEELIGAADAALYLAKTNGRNRVQAHQPEP